MSRVFRVIRLLMPVRWWSAIFARAIKRTSATYAGSRARLKGVSDISYDTVVARSEFEHSAEMQLSPG